MITIPIITINSRKGQLISNTNQRVSATPADRIQASLPSVGIYISIRSMVAISCDYQCYDYFYVFIQDQMTQCRKFGQSFLSEIDVKKSLLFRIVSYVGTRAKHHHPIITSPCTTASLLQQCTCAVSE